MSASIPPPAPISLGTLAECVADLKRQGKTVTQVRGLFDLLGREDVARLRDLVTEGNRCIVITITGSGASSAPLLDARIRAATVASLPFVHAVGIEGALTREECAEIVGADEIVTWDDADGATKERTGVHDGLARAKLVYSRRGSLTPEADAFLDSFCKRHSVDTVISSLRSLSDLRVLVVGDAIIDEYHFVRPYGMPLKSPVIAAQFEHAEVYAGGALAVANHLAGFCKEVHLVTALGADDSRETFIRETLLPNVDPKFFYRPNAPTTAKRRYLTHFLVQKLFELGIFDERPLPASVDAALATHLGATCADYDLVVVADFGHGCLSQSSIDAISANARFLAVNTQLNSVNYGYHVVTRYKKVDYVCIDENEMRMACRDRFTPVVDVLPALAASLEADIVTVTRGHHGSLTYDKSGTLVTVPILSQQVVDTIGAGDAYLAVTAPCVQQRVDPEVVGLIGNAVGALAVRILGNKRPVGPDSLFAFIRALLEQV
jgi:sugar/nucleoside kinase (ribokinase family)